MTSAAIEILLWSAIFFSSGQNEIAGFTREYYLAYALWSAFISRITVSWMYEFRMVDDVDTGAINSLLVRPISFFEYYLSQLLAYKLLTTLISIFVPISVGLYFHLPLELKRLPLVLLMIVYYLVFLHTVSFCVACFAFFFNRVYSLVAAKNLFIMLLTGEILPVDMIPSPLKEFLLKLPFVAAAYLPVAYLTGRIGDDLFMTGFFNITLGLIVLGTVAAVLWKSGLKKYSGTGA